MYPRLARLLLPAALLGLAASACAAPGAPAGSTTENRSWSQVIDQAKGQTVAVWIISNSTGVSLPRPRCRRRRW